MTQHDETRGALTEQAITVWKDGRWKMWRRADADYAQNDPDWLTTISLPAGDGLTPEALADAVPNTATIIYGEDEAVRMNYDELRQFANNILAAPRQPGEVGAGTRTLTDALIEHEAGVFGHYNGEMGQWVFDEYQMLEFARAVAEQSASRYPPCKGTNCGTTTYNHSQECQAEHDRACGYVPPAASAQQDELGDSEPSWRDMEQDSDKSAQQDEREAPDALDIDAIEYWAREEGDGATVEQTIAMCKRIRETSGVGVAMSDNDILAIAEQIFQVKGSPAWPEVIAFARALFAQQVQADAGAGVFGYAHPLRGNYFTRDKKIADAIGYLIPVYTHPSPAAESDKRDAERYRWLREQVHAPESQWDVHGPDEFVLGTSDLDGSVDAAMSRDTENGNG